MNEEQEFTGVLPRRFRKWSYGILASVGLVVVFYGWLGPDEVELWKQLVLTVFTGSNGVAAFNTRGEVTVN